MDIRVDNLQGPEIVGLLREHLQDMRLNTPLESVHALDIEALRSPAITVWSVWKDAEIMGCGALKALASDHGEIKSMRTVSNHRRKGVAAQLLAHILQEAKRRSYRHISLETGGAEEFAPARALYTRFGFQECGPFGDYGEDPNSIFMSREL
ncbi:MAG: GNAT family N-acetyltransferase [Elainellaceae cyanobacterium]